MGAEPELPLAHLWIVGAGRLGSALALLLHGAGAAERITLAGRRPTPPPHPLLASASVRYQPDLRRPDPSPDAVLLAVPDSQLPAVVGDLAAVGLEAGVPVLHTSGALSAHALTPLAEAGLATGSIHPLAAVADPVAGVERLRGAWFALEGGPAARALGERVVRAAGGRTLRVGAEGKVLYHAAAVFASNYVVALLAVAERLFAEAGVDAAAAAAAAAELAGGAVANAAERGTVAALTGPVSRGDVETVRLHLARLSPPDRALYSVLAGQAVAIARRQGLDAGAAARLETLLGEDP